MKRFMGVSLGCAGGIFGLFILNLVLFSNVPAYRNALENMISADKNVPVVIPEMVGNKESEQVERIVLDEAVPQAAIIGSQEMTDNIVIEGTVDNSEIERISDITSEGTGTNEVGKNYEISFDGESVLEEAPSLHVVDKTYHEDCGSGKGYWTVTYEDGSVKVEK